MQKLFNRSKPLETKPLGQKVMVHGAMHYKCERCGEIHTMWLEKGLEDAMQREKDPESHKPVPFCIGCNCGGMAKHILWQTDIKLDDYRPLQDGESYFENAPNSNCGISHLRERRDCKEAKMPECEELELKEALAEDKEISTVALGLENYTMSQLKAEIRRRKRW